MLSQVLLLFLCISGLGGDKTCHMSNENNPGCSGYIGDYTTQLYGDYND